MRTIADEVEESLPDSVVVRACVLRDEVRRDGAEQVVGAGHRTVEEEQPRRLQVRDLAHPLPKARLNP